MRFSWPLCPVEMPDLLVAWSVRQFWLICLTGLHFCVTGCAVNVPGGLGGKEKTSNNKSRGSVRCRLYWNVFTDIFCCLFDESRARQVASTAGVIECDTRSYRHLTLSRQCKCVARCFCVRLSSDFNCIVSSSASSLMDTFVSLSVNSACLLVMAYKSSTTVDCLKSERVHFDRVRMYHYCLSPSSH